MARAIWLSLIAACIALLAYLFSKPPRLSLPLHLEGNALRPFKNVVQIFRQHIESGFLKGGAFVVYHKGKLVVDLHGGYANLDRKLKWKPDTITCVHSVSKAMAALCLAILVDRGHASYDNKISKYWPEFAENGKDEITIRTLLAHKTGLVLLDEQIQFSDLIEPADKKRKILARQKPQWTPGLKQGYQTLTHGLYMDEIIRRIDPKHRDIQTIIDQELAKPFGLDLMIGLTEQDYKRTSIPVWHDWTFLEMLMETPWKEVLHSLYTGEPSFGRKSVDIIKDFVKDQDKFENNIIPWSSGSGAGTAKSLAKMISVLTTKGRLDDKRMLSESLVSEILQENLIVLDETLQIDLAFGLGFMQMKFPKGGRIFGHLGFGGHYVFADVENELAFAFTTNDVRLYSLGEDPRARSLIDGVYDSLEKMNAIK
ncbi:beta-lactamase domain-containing protein 2-like [Tubulanus polymorphus]|uniref:beta-lactamase domain-containing protein 2-like n=1 Tax=Tubulanus polymorphus TaxID=672921 RepID=UPI003DA435DF